MSRVVTLPPDEPLAADGSKIGGWWRDADDGQRVVCGLCPRSCALRPGDRGFCFVRENRGGRMVSTTFGRSTGFCVDPIEKKPLNHFFPGTSVLSFGTPGCNLACKFCQNWTMSRSRDVAAACEWAEPETIATAARGTGCRSVAFTYNDPIVWAEYAIETARACRRAGILTVAVTSGYITPAARGPFFECIDAANVDLKGFTEEFYEKFTGGRLAPVLDTLRWLVHESDTWLEITHLIIPRANDSPEDIERMCRWIHDELGPDVPLHLTAFHPDFKMTDYPPTPRETLMRAHDTARQTGLRYVYTGNISDAAHQATCCPGCGRMVVRRDGFLVGEYHIRNGCCAECGGKIAGRFDDAAGGWDGRRVPVRVGSFAAPAAVVSDRPALSPQQEERVMQAAGQRVAAAVVHGSRPPIEAILGDAARTTVYGAFVTLKRAGQLRSCCGFLGDGVPLAEALDHAAVRAARDDPRFPPIAAEELNQLDIDVWLLWGLRPVTARGHDRIGAITIGKHGLQIARGAARGLLLPGVAVEHHLDAEAFLEQVCLKAGLPRSAWLEDDAKLMTFEGRAIHGRLRVQQADHGEGVASRPPAAAGPPHRGFYPDDPREMARMLDELFAGQPETAPEAWPAVMVPHAGWVYSGRLAAAVFRRVRIPERVIIVCPRHRPAGANWAVAPFRRWLLPSGHMDADPELARRLAESVSGLELDAAAHQQEHALEVQLPLLARLAPQARVVGVALGGGSLATLLRAAEQLAGLLRELPECPLLVISSDMNHFADEAQTRRLDRLALDAIEKLDPVALFETVQEHHISMCGMRPAVLVMETLRQLGVLRRTELVGYTTSAEASGETDRVVGYAGMLLG